MALIELVDVVKHVPLPSGEDLHILRGLNLSVEAGEHVSIVGRSGTGKSTLLNIVGLLDKPSSGRYFVDGRDTRKLGEGRRAHMRGNMFGFVFQQFNIFSARTAQENVEVPLLYTSGSQFWRRHDLATSMLGRVGLGDRLDSYPTEMSGGEQQRIAIARALVRRPRIILADEPTGALDLDTGRSVMELLEKVAEESDAALIVITHDVNVATRADRVLSLYDGVLHPVENPHTDLSSGSSRAVSDLGDGVVAGRGESLSDLGRTETLTTSEAQAPGEILVTKDSAEFVSEAPETTDGDGSGGGGFSLFPDVEGAIPGGADDVVVETAPAGETRRSSRSLRSRWSRKARHESN